MTVRFIDEADSSKGKVRFLDESPKDPSIGEILEKGPAGVVHEMFGKDPSAGGAYNIASVPSRKIGAGLRKIIGSIPDPETQSAVLNAVLGTPKTVGDIGADFAESSLTPEGVALAGVPFGKLAKKAGRVIEKNAPAVSQAMTGVSKKYFSALTKNRKLVLPEFLGGPKSLEKAGGAVGAAEKRAFGKLADPLPEEINDTQLTQAREIAVRVMNQLDELAKIGDDKFADEFLSQPEIGADVLKARRATDVQLNQPSVRGSQRALLTAQKERLNKVIEKYFPDVREANLDYAKSAANENLTKILPVLKSGDPSYMRIVLSAMGRGAGLPLGFNSPVVHAGLTALSGVSVDALRRLALVPRIRELALSELARRKSSGE